MARESSKLTPAVPPPNEDVQIVLPSRPALRPTHETPKSCTSRQLLKESGASPNEENPAVPSQSSNTSDPAQLKIRMGATNPPMPASSKKPESTNCCPAGTSCSQNPYAEIGKPTRLARMRTPFPRKLPIGASGKETRITSPGCASA
ncbi:MAG: hypothetical protein IPN34_12550 [Planctomycetes bacterium]|nr:hypothetical protein [Planctomycetota bacterium]